MTPVYNIGAIQALQFERLRCEETLHSLFESFGHFLELESLPVDKFIVLPHHVYNLSNNSEYLKNINIIIFIDVSEHKPYNLEEEWSDDTDGGSDNDEGKLCYLYS